MDRWDRAREAAKVGDGLLVLLALGLEGGFYHPSYAAERALTSFLVDRPGLVL